MNVLVAAAFLLLPGAEAGTLGLEDWVKRHYMRHDPHEGWARANRFHELGRVQERSFLEWPERTEYLSAGGNRYIRRNGSQEPFEYSQTTGSSARQALSELLKCELSLEPKSDLFVVGTVDTEEGRFISFLLNRVTDHPTRREYLWSIAFVRDAKCLDLGDVPRDVDSETGRFRREVWDLFAIHGTSYLLVWKRGYEEERFEIFEVREDDLVLKETLLYWSADE